MNAPKAPANATMINRASDPSETSKETNESLNQNIRVGYTAQRGRAWWYRASLDGETPNHFDGPVPIESVRELFESLVLGSEPVFVGKGKAQRPYIGTNGKPMQAITNLATGQIFKVFTDGYQIHKPWPWFVEHVADILDTPQVDLGIGSAGLLEGGAKMFTQIELPENARVDGIEFRPSLLSFGSVDGSLSSTYKWVNTVVICDNSFRRARAEQATQVKVRHTRHSLNSERATSTRAALGVQFEQQADEFAVELTALLETPVTDPQWHMLLDELVKVPTEKGKSQTMAMNKRDTLNSLWVNDMRVAPWAGTAFGVSQAFNTYRHHYQTVRNATRVERNYLNAITDEGAKADEEVMAKLTGILANV